MMHHCMDCGAYDSEPHHHNCAVHERGDLPSGRSIALTLPFPPAVNNITAVVRGRKITSKRGRQYRDDAVTAIKAQYQGAPLAGRLAVRLVLIPPCRRKRDIDNYSKACLDAITAAGVWVDDEQVDQLTIVRGEKAAGGGCLVEIVEIAEAA